MISRFSLRARFLCSPLAPRVSASSHFSKRSSILTASPSSSGSSLVSSSSLSMSVKTTRLAPISVNLLRISCFSWGVYSLVAAIRIWQLLMSSGVLSVRWSPCRFLYWGAGSSDSWPASQMSMNSCSLVSVS